jgi:hypothetical protein
LARADRVLDGLVAADGIPLHDGNLASVGDEIVTRQNDRRLTTGSGAWVKNGDRWTVTGRFDDGSLTVRRLHRDGSSGGAIVLPAGYVADHVELGYATTVHRAQGLTVDTAHAVIDPDTATRELLYVAMTRGAVANHVYVGVEEDRDPEHGHRDTSSRFAHSATEIAIEALATVMGRVGAEQAATEVLRLAVAEHSSVATLANEFETIAAHAISIGAARPDPRHQYSVADTIPWPDRRMPAEYYAALRERSVLIHDAVALARGAAERTRDAWTAEVAPSAMDTTMLYRLRYGVTDPDRPLGDPAAVTSKAQARNYEQAHHRINIRRHELHDDHGRGHSHSIDRGYGIGL